MMDNVKKFTKTFLGAFGLSLIGSGIFAVGLLSGGVLVGALSVFMAGALAFGALPRFNRQASGTEMLVRAITGGALGAGLIAGGVAGAVGVGIFAGLTTILSAGVALGIAALSDKIEMPVTQASYARTAHDFREIENSISQEKSSKLAIGAGILLAAGMILPPTWSYQRSNGFLKEFPVTGVVQTLDSIGKAFGSAAGTINNAGLKKTEAKTAAPVPQTP